MNNLQDTAAELRTLRLAIRNACRAFDANNPLSLATINPSVQPLADATIAYARRVFGWEKAGRERAERSLEAIRIKSNRTTPVHPPPAY